MASENQTGRVLGLDVGDVRIGVALSDPTGLLASPLDTIKVKSWEQAIQRIVELVREHGVEQVVVGLPVSLSGHIGPQAQKVQDFIAKLESHLTVPVATWDESYSTVEANEMMREAGTRKSRRKNLRDAAAATVILQQYLDSQKNQLPQPSTLRE